MCVYSNLTYFSIHQLLTIPHTYIIEYNGASAGMCGVYLDNAWIKIGPLVLLSRFQGLGLSRKIITAVMRDFSKQNMLILSSHVKVQHIIGTLGFEKLQSLGDIPLPFKIFLCRQLITLVSPTLILEKIRKSVFLKPGRLYWYVRRV